MITRVVINGYKSLWDVDIELGALTLVIGPNASGKSNLLDALGLLSRMVTGGTITSAFQEHRGNPLEAFFVPPGGLEELLSKSVLTFSLGVEVELSDATVGTVERRIRDMREGLPADSRADRPVGIDPEESFRLWAAISCPTLLVRGLESWVGDPEDDGRATHFRNARFVDVAGAGHWVHHDRLDEFLGLVRGFLAEAEAA